MIQFDFPTPFPLGDHDDLIWSSLAAAQRLAQRNKVRFRDPREQFVDSLSVSEIRRGFWRPVFDLHSAMRSAAISTDLDTTYDVVIIGGGALSTHIDAEIRGRNAGFRVLVLEAEGGCRPFRVGGDAFLLNTETGSGRHTLPRIEPDDLSEQRFMEAGVLYDAVRADWFLGGTRVWTHARVTDIQGVAGDWRLMVQHLGGRSTLSARAIVLATGFGAPRCSGLVSALWPSAQVMPHEAKMVGEVLTAETLLSHAAWGSLRTAHWWTNGARIAVVGAGPSAYAAWSVLFGHLTSAVRGLPHVQGRWTWFTGRDGAITARSLLEGAAARLGSHAMAAVLGERYLSLWFAMAKAENEGRLQVVHRDGLAERGPGRQVRIDGQVFDAVIDATGFAPRRDPLLAAWFARGTTKHDGEFLEADGAFAIGDCVGDLCEENLALGPLQQWTAGARRLGMLLVERLVAPAAPRKISSNRPNVQGGSTRHHAPALPCVYGDIDLAGVRWLDTLTKTQIPSASTRIEDSDAGPHFVLAGLSPYLAEAWQPRSRSIFLQERP